MKHLKEYNNYLVENPLLFLHNLKEKYVDSRLNLFIDYEITEYIDSEVITTKKDSEFIFKIADIRYHQDKINGFHIFKLIKNDSNNQWINIIIDPNEPDYPKSLYLRVENYKVNIYNWKDILHDFIMEVNEFYL